MNEITVRGHNWRSCGSGQYISAADVSIKPAPPNYGSRMVWLCIGDVDVAVNQDELVRAVHAAVALWGPIEQTQIADKRDGDRSC